MNNALQAVATPVISGIPLTGAQLRAIELAGGTVLLDDAAHREEAALDAAPSVEVWFGGGLTPPILAAAGKLKWLQADGNGVDHYLFPELVASPVAVTSIRRRHVTTADHAMTLLLAVARSLPALIQQQAQRTWKQPIATEILPLAGTRIVIIGTGQIGSAVAARASAFGMIPEGVSRSGEPRPGFARMYRSNGLVEAVRGATWVVDTCPLTPETTGLVSEAVISAMSPGAVFVNVGRGKTVDQQALTRALKAGRLRAAALDVFVDEPLPADDDLWGLPNVLVTPHSAGVIANAASSDLGVAALVENLTQYRDGRPLTEPIDKVRGY